MVHACEEKGSMVTHGAVIIDVASQTREFFGDHIPAHLVQQWRNTGRSQLIFFAELYPILIARRTWAKVLRNRRVLIFIDNEAAKAALIRNYSPLVDAALIARRTWAKVLRNRRVLIFIDNEAAKAALIRNYSPLVDAAHMLSEIAALDVQLECFPWYCRVPSKSNFSDAASRLAFGEYEECFRRVQPLCGT
eukprot:s148_g30.t1